MTSRSAVFRVTVPPRHTDAQGMVHASRYYEYFEDAFLHWLDAHLGGYPTLRATGTDLVVVASGCEHHQGARLGDELAIEVQPVGAGRASLEVAFDVRTGTGDPVASGHTTYVAVSDRGSVPLPECLRTLAEP
jgi:acyl-CoA thioester hydrolase